MHEITPEVVEHVAQLSRLELAEGEARSYAADLDKILHYVEKLAELDTTSVPPTSHAFPQSNVFREDHVGGSLTNEAALANAPDAEDECFKVPAVLQGSGGA